MKNGYRIYNVQVRDNRFLYRDELYEDKERAIKVFNNIVRSLGKKPKKFGKEKLISYSENIGDITVIIRDVKVIK